MQSSRLKTATASKTTLQRGFDGPMEHGATFIFTTASGRNRLLSQLGRREKTPLSPHSCRLWLIGDLSFMILYLSPGASGLRPHHVRAVCQIKRREPLGQEVATPTKPSRRPYLAHKRLDRLLTPAFPVSGVGFEIGA